jgi:long-chain acyl-CoA synthetase
MVIGEGEKMPAAIIQPHFEFLIEWAKRKDINTDYSFQSLINNEKVIKRIQKEIDKTNTSFGKWEQIKSFKLTNEIWSVENGLLTPTMKIKRSAIKEKYKTLYNLIYNK